MDEDLKNLLEAMRQENAAAHAATRRHFEVLADGLRHELRLVAEGVASNTVKIERLDENVERLYSELDTRVTRIEAAQRR